jgi:hypothetical protein
MAFTLANSATYRANRANLTFNGQPSPNFFLANPNANFSRALTNASFSNYHSFQAEIRRRLSKGLQLQANYTFSKALSDSDGGGQSTLEQYLTWRNLGLDKHRTTFDQPHRFIANFIYELPFGTGRRWLNSGAAPLRKLVEGWQAGSIINIQSGNPIFITSGRSTFNQFTGNIGAQLSGASFDDFKNKAGVFKLPSGVVYFDPSLLNVTTSSTTGLLTGAALKSGLLSAPAPGTFGNFPRNSINGPGYWQVDISVTKRTKIGERADMEFKSTFYNAFNHANFNFGTVNFDSSTLGRINSTRGSSRVIHFILGVNF